MLYGIAGGILLVVLLLSAMDEINRLNDPR